MCIHICKDNKENKKYLRLLIFYNHPTSLGQDQSVASVYYRYLMFSHVTFVKSYQFILYIVSLIVCKLMV